MNILLFVIGDRTYKFSKNTAILVLSTSFFFSVTLGFLHVVTYKGMNLIAGIDTSMATQFWIARRFIESSGILASTFIKKKEIKYARLMFISLVINSLLIASIFTKVFPVCFIEGVGLTPFKKISEYVIILISIVTIFRIKNLNDHFETDYRRLFSFALLFGILAEATLTFYITVDDLANGVGHLFYLLSIGFFSLFVIKEGLDKPYSAMFHEVHRQAIRDSLTGLYNRNGLYEIVSASYERKGRYYSSLHLFNIDLDNFKTINDKYGHPEGDRALVEFGKILVRSFRESDIIARIGGDEFVIVLECDDEELAQAQERLESAVAAWVSSNPKRFGLGISYGIAAIEPHSAATIDDTLAIADQALLKVKASKHPERIASKAAVVDKES